jgi:hypothetical protein
MDESSLRHVYALAEVAPTPLGKALTTIRQRWATRRGDAVIVGGLLRAITMGEQPRDIDVVTRDLADMRGFRVRKTNFGGSKIFIEGVEVDVWPIALSWGVNHLGLNYTLSWTEFLQTTFFNIEAIMLDPSTGEVFDRGFFECLSSKVLEINLLDNPVPSFQLLRAAVLCRRYGLTCGPRLREFIAVEGAKTTVSRLFQMQRLHYGQEYHTVETLQTFIEASS